MAIPILGPIAGAVGGGIMKGIGKVAGPLVTGALGLGGQQLANQANAKEAQRARQFSAAEAEKARQFTDQQSSTAIQRRVQDYKDAGLNPLLAYQGGADTGASPAAAATAAAPMQNIASHGITSALSAFQFGQEVQNSQAQRENTWANAELTRQQALSVRERRMYEIMELASRVGTNNAQRDRILRLLNPELNEITARTRGHTAKAHLDELGSSEARAWSDMYQSDFGKQVPYLNSGSGALGQALTTLNLGRHLAEKAFRSKPVQKRLKVSPNLSDRKPITRSKF